LEHFKYRWSKTDRFRLKLNTSSIFYLNEQFVWRLFYKLSSRSWISSARSLTVCPSQPITSGTTTLYWRNSGSIWNW